MTRRKRIYTEESGNNSEGFIGVGSCTLVLATGVLALARMLHDPVGYVLTGAFALVGLGLILTGARLIASARLTRNGTHTIQTLDSYLNDAKTLLKSQHLRDDPVAQHTLEILTQRRNQIVNALQKTHRDARKDLDTPTSVQQREAALSDAATKEFLEALTLLETLKDQRTQLADSSSRHTTQDTIDDDINVELHLRALREDITTYDTVLRHHAQH